MWDKNCISLIFSLFVGEREREALSVSLHTSQVQEEKNPRVLRKKPAGFGSGFSKNGSVNPGRANRAPMAACHRKLKIGTKHQLADYFCINA